MVEGVSHWPLPAGTTARRPHRHAWRGVPRHGNGRRSWTCVRFCHRQKCPFYAAIFAVSAPKTGSGPSDLGDALFDAFEHLGEQNRTAFETCLPLRQRGMLPPHRSHLRFVGRSMSTSLISCSFWLRSRQRRSHAREQQRSPVLSKSRSQPRHAMTKPLAPRRLMPRESC